jgi:predicted NBD/HSP70 family sugar kinase
VADDSGGPAIGVDVGGTKMLVVARDPSGALIAEALVPTGPATTGAWLERRIREFGETLDGRVGRIAIAVPGLVVDHAEVRSCDVLPRLAGWRPGVDLVINDIRAALASVTDSSGADDRGPVLCVVAGTAIGAAFTDTGGHDVFDGADGWAGELGYLPIGPAPDGRIQRLDDLAGGHALLAALRLSAADVHGRLAAGDAVVRSRVEAAGAALGLGLAACVNLLNPRTLVLGGGHLPVHGLSRRRGPHRRGAQHPRALEHSPRPSLRRRAPLRGRRSARCRPPPWDTRPFVGPVL